MKNREQNEVKISGGMCELSRTILKYLVLGYVQCLLVFLLSDCYLLYVFCCLLCCN